MCKPDKRKVRLLTAVRIFAIFSALWSLMFVTDSVQNILNNQPVFTVMIDDGEGSRHSTYLGLFYVIYIYEDPMACPAIEGFNCSAQTYHHVEMHPWFYKGN